MPTFTPDFLPSGRAGDDLVLSWLETLLPDDLSLSSPDCTVCQSKTTTSPQLPPGMSSSRQGSPSKRQKLEAGDNPGGCSTAADDDATSGPSPGGAVAVALAAPNTCPPSLVHSHILPHSQTQQMASHYSERSMSINSQQTGNSRRSKRPTKSSIRRVADMLYFDNPVQYDPDAEGPLPHGLQEMRQAIDDINFLMGIFPMEIRDEILAELGRSSLPDTMFSSNISRGEAQSTLARVMEIVKAARLSRQWNRSDAAWNLLVHWPVLRLALSDLQDVVPELITTASIVPPFLPRFALPLASDSGVDATVSQGKTVDFALVLMPPSGSPLQQAMWHLLRDLPMDKKCLSQTDYGPLYFFPAPVAIATKAPNGDKEEAKIQLGIWTAAWFKRMRELLWHVGRASDERVISVPLLMAEGQHWSLYYAHETDQNISIHGPVEIGETSSITNTFRLLAALKVVGKWVTNQFRDWFTAQILKDFMAADEPPAESHV